MEIKSKLNTPYVKIDKEKCILSIIGRSYPEHPSLFYDPILLEIDKCKSDLSESKITIKVALEIINSVSIKYLLHLIKDLHESSEIEVNWYYESDDICMLDDGKNIEMSLPKLDIKLIEVNDLRETQLKLTVNQH
jgi:hypothetical protein